MLDRRQLAGRAAIEALRLRKRLGTDRALSISPVDAAEQLGIEVRLIDLPSMEGIYVSGDNPKIVLSTARPSGRRNFTCAHELGHHVFGHGAQFDELKDERLARRTVDPNEFLADCFAGYFLMPKSAIDAGALLRKFDIGTITPQQAFSLASWLGVGYTTLVSHLQYSLRMIGSDHASRLRSVAVGQIKHSIAGFSINQALHIVDPSWLGRAVDCEVGDYILAPRATMCEGSCVDIGGQTSTGIATRAVRPGIARLSGVAPLWSAYIRVSPHRFIGRACFRFDEEIEE